MQVFVRRLEKMENAILMVCRGNMGMLKKSETGYARGIAECIKVVDLRHTVYSHFASPLYC